MSPMWCVFLLIVLAALWICWKNCAAGRESYRALPPQTACEPALLATIGLWAALRGVSFLITLRQPSALLVVVHLSVAALALLAALYRPRQS